MTDRSPEQRERRPHAPERRGSADGKGQRGGPGNKQAHSKQAESKQAGSKQGGSHQGGSHQGGSRQGGPRRAAPRFAALDLGTNNCRLLIASPRGKNFRIVDAFSRIVRLGEGLAADGRLSDAAMDRTIDALAVCAEKIARRGVTRTRAIATQACRAASNGEEFLHRVRSETGLDLEIISTEEEARLAVLGCRDLLDRDASGAVIFDIGGGSTEVSFLDFRGRDFPGSGASGTSGASLGASERDLRPAGWFSMPIGVVNLTEQWGGTTLTADGYRAIVESVAETIRGFGDPAGFAGDFERGGGHLLGTSGTVTSIAGVHLGLDRYRRDRVDGIWLSSDDARAISRRLLHMTNDERAAEPCIGVERADLVVCGCAILEALLTVWPTRRIRVADRGLREGILVGLKRDEDKRRRRRKRRRRKATDRQAG